MGGVGVIDRFLQVFTSYIDSGFGLLGGDVAFLATTLIVDAGYTGSFSNDSCGGSKYLNCMQAATDNYSTCLKDANAAYPDKSDPDLQAAKSTCQNQRDLEEAACAEHK